MKRGGVNKNMYLSLILISVIISIFFISFSYINTSSKNPNFLTGFIIFSSQPDSTNGTDTYIRNSSDLNFGTDTVIKLGKTAAGSQYHGLILFNISTIPLSSVTNAVIRIHVLTLNTNNITVKAYRVTSSWDELNATWNNATASSLWSLSGGDFDATELSTAIINQTSQWYNFSILNAARGWINSSYPNYGIILIPQNTANNNLTEIASSDYTIDETLRPQIVIDYTSNAPPSIINISSNSNLTNIKKVGENVTLTVAWTDLEADSSNLFICRNSTISVSGCASSQFCNSSSSSPSSCQYTILSTDNRTTNFWAAVCDAGNCSSINQSSFSMNHIPNITLINPNGGETINQSLGNYRVKFNVSDNDSDKMFASIYYGESQYNLQYQINSSLNLTQTCSDPDSNTATANNCSYLWNTTGIYGNYFITIFVNDSFHPVNTTSSSSFSVVSLTDLIPPNITGQWIEDIRIYSGRKVQIYANVSEPNIKTVWASINTTLQQNITMLNSTFGTYNATFTAPSIGTYLFKVYANDTTGNLNDSQPYTSFNVSKPIANPQNTLSPSSSIPYNVIKITSQLNSSDPLVDVFAFLNIPDSFTFLSDYNQNTNTGNYTSNETKTATWYISTPITEANYTLNATFTDNYLNQWNSSNTYVNVKQSQDSYSLSIAGYPEVQTSANYYIQGFFKNNGNLENPDSMTVLIYDSINSLIVGPASMTSQSTGTYNYSYTIGASVNEGQWKTIINATKNSINYLATSFWKVVGGPFDVRNISIDNSAYNTLEISVIVENTGGAIKDMSMTWNLTKESDGSLLDSGAETFAVAPASTRTYTIAPTTTFIGQARITFLGSYSGTEKAGAFKVFSITSASTAPSAGTSGGGGGGSAIIIEENASISITTEKLISLTKNIKKKIIFEIENIGKKTLTNISLSIKDLDEKYYSISPPSIKQIKSGEIKDFTVEFLVTDYLGEKEFLYLLKTNEITKKISGILNITTIEEFFPKEIKRLSQLIDDLNSKLTDEKLKKELEKCADIVSQIEDKIKKEEFISANDDIIKAENCIKTVQKSSLKPVSKPFEMPTLPNITLILFIVIVLAILFVIIYLIYKIYKKLNLITFFKSEELRKKPKGEKRIKEEDFNEKIRRIEEKLGHTESTHEEDRTEM